GLRRDRTDAASAQPGGEDPAGRDRAPRLGVFLGFLDRDVDEVAPLGPRAVVVLDVPVAEQLAEDEPGVRAALADPAVRAHLLVGAHALALVQVPQLVGRLEGAVVAHCLRPRDRPRPGDVTGPRGALLLVPGRRNQ